jgi:hypothetical protein
MLPPEKEATTLEPWAVAIGLATLVLVGAVALFTTWDRMHNSQLETIITPTAVGDTNFVQKPLRRTGPIGLKYQGRKLDLLSDNKIRDSRLLRIGTDDSGIYSIYRPEDDKELPKDHFLMKSGTNDFIEVVGE